MANYIDISEWNEKPWFGTKGTRNKTVVENPDTGIYCYFKTSLSKPDKDYKFEFWSEILASEIGQFLGYNILKYDIAFRKSEIGCVSEFMNTEGENELTEGIQYLTGYNSAYKPDKKESKSEYTFQFICDALKSFDFKGYIVELIKIVIFDSLISNGDRHQENWGIITSNKEAINFYTRASKNKGNPFILRMALKLFIWALKHFPSLPMPFKVKLHNLMPNKFAPIYDSGSCLGRELLDEDVKQLLSNEMQLIRYINRGKSEIHWLGKKISHFELIKNISKEYHEEVKTEILRVKEIYNEKEISRIVMEIDKQLPKDKLEFELPENRKELIVKMISLRFGELIKILD